MVKALNLPFLESEPIDVGEGQAVVGSIRVDLPPCAVKFPGPSPPRLRKEVLMTTRCHSSKMHGDVDAIIGTSMLSNIFPDGILLHCSEEAWPGREGFASSLSLPVCICPCYLIVNRDAAT
jgi:hypothetical protein